MTMPSDPFMESPPDWAIQIVSQASAMMRRHTEQYGCRPTLLFMPARDYEVMRDHKVTKIAGLTVGEWTHWAIGSKHP